MSPQGSNQDKIGDSLKEIIDSIPDKIVKANQSYRAGQSVPVQLGGNRGIVRAIAKTKIEGGSDFAVVRGNNGDRFAIQGNQNQIIIQQTVINDRWEMSPLKPSKEEKEIGNLLILWLDKNDNTVILTKNDGTILYQQTTNISNFSNNTGKVKVFKEDGKNKWCISFFEYYQDFTKLTYAENFLNGSLETLIVKTVNTPNVFDTEANSYTTDYYAVDGDLLLKVSNRDASGEAYISEFDRFDDDCRMVHRAEAIFAKGIVYPTTTNVLKQDASQPSSTASYSSQADIEEIGIKYSYSATAYYTRLLDSPYNSNKEITYNIVDELTFYDIKTEINASLKYALGFAFYSENAPIGDQTSQVIGHPTSVTVKFNDKILTAEDFLYPETISIREEENYNNYKMIVSFYQNDEDETKEITFTTTTRVNRVNLTGTSFNPLVDRLIGQECFCCGFFEENQHVVCKGHIASGTIQDDAKPFYKKLTLTVRIEKKDKPFFHVAEIRERVLNGFYFHPQTCYVMRTAHNSCWHNLNLFLNPSNYPTDLATIEYNTYFSGADDSIYNFIWARGTQHFSVRKENGKVFITAIGPIRQVLVFDKNNKKKYVTILEFEVDELVKGLSKPTNAEIQTVEIPKKNIGDGPLICLALAYYSKKVTNEDTNAA